MQWMIWKIFRFILTGHCSGSKQIKNKSFVRLEGRCRLKLDEWIHMMVGRQHGMNAHIFLPSCPSRDQEWQPKEHPGSLFHPVPLQAAAAATAAVLPVPGGAQPADQQHHTVRQQPQDTRDAVQVRCTPRSCVSVVWFWFGSHLWQR